MPDFQDMTTMPDLDVASKDESAVVPHLYASSVAAAGSRIAEVPDLSAAHMRFSIGDSENETKLFVLTRLSQSRFPIVPAVAQNRPVSDTSIHDRDVVAVMMKQKNKIDGEFGTAKKYCIFVSTC